MKLRAMATKVAAIMPNIGISRIARACPRLHVGHKYYIDGYPYIFDRYFDDGVLLFKCPRTDLALRTDLYDLRSPLPDAGWLTEAMAAGRFSHKPAPKKGVLTNRHMMDEAQARKLDPISVLRFNILVGTDRYGTRPDDVAISTVVDEVFAKYPEEAVLFGGRPTVKTVRDWRKHRGSFGDRTWRDCVSNSGRSRTVRLSKELLALVIESALHFWSDFTLNYWRAFSRLQSAIARRNAKIEDAGEGERLECPAFTTFLRYANYLATYDAVKAKLGEKAAKALVSVGKMAEATRILETVQADHTIIDAMVLDDITGAEIGRPTLTIIVDVKSRCILGYYISFDPPCFASVVQCFRRCLLPKINCAGSDEFMILQDIFGLPTLLVVDNAMEFVGINMQDAMNDLGVALTFPPVKTPEAKPFVERLLGTLNTKAFHAVDGTTFNKAGQAKRGGDYKPKASVTLNGLNDLIEQVIYAYHVSPHAGLNERPPALVWQEDAMRFGIPVLYDLDRLDAILAATKLRVLARDGIQLFGLMYNHGPTVTLTLAEFDGASFKSTEPVKIKYNPYDLGSIWFYHPIKREYLRLPAMDPDYASGLSVFQHERIRAHLKEQGLAFSSGEQRLKARQVVENKLYEITPGLLQKQRKNLARLVAKESIQGRLEDLGLTSVTGIALLPHEPLLSRTSDGGALPKGAARGAAKAKKTRAQNTGLRNSQADPREGFNPDDDDLLSRFEDADWKGYDDE